VRRPVRLAALITALATVAACSAPSLSSLPAPQAVSGPTYELTADFHDVLNLPIGAKVKNAGVVIGQVTGISTTSFIAHVRMRIRRSVRLPIGTTAQVRFTTPLGEDYIAVTVPAAGGAPIAQGGRLPVTATSSAPTIEDAFAALSLLVNGGGLDKAGTIVRELNRAISGREGNVRYVLQQTTALVGNLNAHRADIDRALQGLGDLSRELGRNSSVIGAALERFPPALSVLADETDRLTALEQKIASLGTVTAHVLSRGTADLLADLDLLRPALDSLAAARGTLVPTMQALTHFGALVVGSSPGDYLTSSATLTLVFNDTAILPQAPPPASGAAAVHQVIAGSSR
jgi:phospholipid/cholesterol/gamma-HCH transport system substrate-binding protein